MRTTMNVLIENVFIFNSARIKNTGKSSAAYDDIYNLFGKYALLYEWKLVQNIYRMEN